MSDLAVSDEDLNGGDREDNESLDSLSGAESVSLTGEKSGDEGAEEFNLNISFTGGYVPNTDLSRVGKGNPQF